MSDGPALATELASALEDLRNSVADAESAFGNGHLKRSTRDDVVELALVRGMGVFEEFVGELFVLALLGRLGAEVIPLVPSASAEEANLLLVGADVDSSARYVSWMPFKEKAIRRAGRLLTASQPFGRLANRSSEKNTLADLTLVRNRVAHDSVVAREKFEQLALQKGYGHSRAADYLTSSRGGTQEILLALATLESIGKGLADPSEMNSRTILSSEDPYSETTLAPPGSYECKRNAHARANTLYQSLGDCDQCPRPDRCDTCGRRAESKTLWVRI